MPSSRIKVYNVALVALVFILSACGAPTSGTPIPTVAARFPIIPIPDRVVYQGIATNHSDSDGYVTIHFFADATKYPTILGASSYGARLLQQGWTHVCEVDCPDVFVSDTQFIGTYQYGTAVDAPTITIGVAMMVKPGEQITLFVRHCGTLTDTRDTTIAIHGCLVQLPPNLATPTP